jgi:hypothetical protein
MDDTKYAAAGALQLYHVTPVRNLAAIQSSGLMPGKSASSLEAVFLAADKATAQNYACMKDEPCALLEVRLEPAVHSLGPDNYELPAALELLDEDDLALFGLSPDAQWNDCSWQQSLEICQQVACYTAIPPQAITVA